MLAYHHLLYPASLSHTNTCTRQVGRVKDKLAEADRKKRRAYDKFVTFVRTAEGLYSSTTWEEFDDAFRGEDEFVAVRFCWGCGCGS